MNSVLLAPWAVFFKLNTLRVILLILLGRIVTAFAFIASQSDQSTH